MKSSIEDKQERNGRRRRSALAINDPMPVAGMPQVWRTVSQGAAIGLFVLALIAAMSLARPGLPD
jgi:hypothetical protein